MWLPVCRRCGRRPKGHASRPPARSSCGCSAGPSGRPRSRWNVWKSDASPTHGLAEPLPSMATSPAPEEPIMATEECPDLRTADGTDTAPPITPTRRQLLQLLAGLGVGSAVFQRALAAQAEP